MPYIESGKFKADFDKAFHKVLGQPEDEQKPEELEDEDEAKSPAKSE